MYVPGWMKMTRAVVDVVEIELTAACSYMKSLALLGLRIDVEHTVVNCPPDFATTIAPDGGEVRAAPSTNAAKAAAANNIFLNIVTNKTDTVQSNQCE